MSNRPVTTKERILNAAEGLMLAKSYHAVGLNEILSAVQVPKGSFYHYFSSKEQFGVELLSHYVDASTAYRTRMLLSPVPEANAFRRLLTFHEGRIAKYHESEGRYPCLVAKLTAEVADFSEDMRAVLAAGVQEWIRILTRVLEEGQSQGSITPQLEAPAAAAILQDLWTGATQRAASSRDAAPMRGALDFIRQWLKA